VAALAKIQKDGLSLEVAFYTSDELPWDLRAWVFELVKSNMEAVYAEDWDDKEKREEIMDDKARFLVATDESGMPQAFVHFRFEIEQDVELCYVYDIQVNAPVQRRGVGKHLMLLVELIAKKNAMKGIMLTSFKNNDVSNSFYLQKLKYVIDPISPSYSNPMSADQYEYEIISKLWDKESQQRLQAQADDARSAWLEYDLEQKVIEKLAAEDKGKLGKTDALIAEGLLPQKDLSKKLR